jgi:hypothetical protein
MTIPEARERLERSVSDLVAAYMRGTRQGVDNVEERETTTKAYHNALDKLVEASRTDGHIAGLGEAARRIIAAEQRVECGHA